MIIQPTNRANEKIKHYPEGNNVRRAPHIHILFDQDYVYKQHYNLRLQREAQARPFCQQTTLLPLRRMSLLSSESPPFCSPICKHAFDVFSAYPEDDLQLLAL